ncbi:hypothetical protein CASFOL_034082 [Castilleja foliolosa]|uniref:Uncharacterized protein n=1 Tax=Castilleja foliolosa TaxID=1961234 RepID=A0ABD3BXQ8_9LAMI
MLEAAEANERKKHSKLLSGEPESSEAGAALDKKMTEQPVLYIGKTFKNRMLMKAAVETLKENKLLRECRRYKLCLKVPEEKIEYLLKMVQMKSEVQMKSDIIGFAELKQVEVAAKYIYERNMFEFENRGGEKFMQIPHHKMNRVGSYHLGFYANPPGVE